MEVSEKHPLACSLVECIRDGNSAALEGLLAENPAFARAVIVDAKGQGRTLLHVATDWPGHFPHVAKVIAILIAAGADPNAAFLPSSDGPTHQETALHWAASSNDVDAIEALLDGGADIEAPGAVFTGGTPLSDAVIFAQWDAARCLLARGASTTLTQAAALGLLARVRELCDLEPPSPDHLTKALWHASRGGDRPTVEFLLEQGADLDWVGWDHQTAVDAARKSGHLALASWLEGQRSALPRTGADSA